MPAGAKAPLDIDDYAWSADGKRLLIFTNTEAVWRQNTRGDYWVLDVAAGRLKQIGGKAPESSLMFAKFSPDGTRVAYVRANNIYVEHLADGRTAALTSDGSETTINGTSDWVYEEELGVRDGFRWSPDGRRIAYWQFDTTGVGIFSLINDTTALYPTITQIPYPKAGTTNSAVRIGVVSAEGGQTTWMQTPGDPREYVPRAPRVARRRHARHPAVEPAAEPERLPPRRCRHRRGDARLSRSVEDVGRRGRGGALDRQGQGVSLDRASATAGGTSIACRGAAGTGPLITRFDADVIDVVGLDEANGWLYFLASPGNATERYLYRSKLDGSGAPERVTPRGSTRHPRLRHGPRRPPGVPHLVALRLAAGDGRRGAARAHRRCAR